ncbi:MAG: hypothetical protein P8164_13855 [Gammaproteobacteria bacterium]|jgi:hypothetical protein
MTGLPPGTVVPFRIGNMATRAAPGLLNAGAVKTYRVTAFYDYPPVERSVVIEAEMPQRAMVKALLEGRVPAFFRKDEFGWLLPIFWHPRLAGGRRWPTIVGRNVIAWGRRGKRDRLIFDVDEVRS